jgi:hypothetical protein
MCPAVVSMRSLKNILFPSNAPHVCILLLIHVCSLLLIHTQYHALSVIDSFLSRDCRMCSLKRSYALPASEYALPVSEYAPSVIDNVLSRLGVHRLFSQNEKLNFVSVRTIKGSSSVLLKGFDRRCSPKRNYALPVSEPCTTGIWTKCVLSKEQMMLSFKQQHRLWAREQDQREGEGGRERERRLSTIKK